MAESIIQSDKVCFLCGRTDHLEKHHVFGGPNRHLSDDDGMIVWLCADCHRNGQNAVHRNADANRYVKECGQRAWEKTYGERADFMKRYGRNYLREEKP